MEERIVQTAGREQLGDFAPVFAHLNDDVGWAVFRLAKDVWKDEEASK